MAVVAGFVAIDQVERTGIVAESAESERGASGGLLLRDRGLGLSAHLVLHAGLFHAPETHLTPAGYGHVFDKRGFDGGFGLKFFVEGGEESAEACLRLTFEDDGVAKHAVSYGVAGGREFALRRGGAPGFGTVGTGGLDLIFGRHTITCCMEEERILVRE